MFVGFLYPVFLGVKININVLIPVPVGVLLLCLPGRAAVLPPALLSGARLLPRLGPGHDSRPAVLSIEQVVNLLGQMLAGQLPVLRAGACVLALDDDSGRDMF